MSDDMWRPATRSTRRVRSRRAGCFDDDEFGGPLFDETRSSRTRRRSQRRRPTRRQLSFGATTPARCPHWTEPADRRDAADRRRDPARGLERRARRVVVVHHRVAGVAGTTCRRTPPASIRSTRPASSPGTTMSTAKPPTIRTPPPCTKRSRARAASRPDHDRHRSVRHPRRPDPPGRRGRDRRPAPAGRAGATADVGRPGRSRSARRPSLPASCWRRCSSSLSMWRPAGAGRFVIVLLASAAIEYFDKVTEKGYRPAVDRRHRRPASPRRSPPTGSASRRVAAGDRVRVHGRRDRVHRRPQRRGRPDAEHGDHHARRRLDRPARFVRRADPAVLDQRPAATPGAPAVGTDTLFLLAIGVVANDIGALLRRLGRRAHAAAAPGSARTRRSRACSAARCCTIVAMVDRRHRRVERHVERARRPARCWPS